MKNRVAGELVLGGGLCQRDGMSRFADAFGLRPTTITNLAPFFTNRVLNTPVNNLHAIPLVLKNCMNPGNTCVEISSRMTSS